MTHDPNLADAWRGSLRNVDECLFYIDQHARTLARPDASNRDRSRASVCLALRLPIYLENVKAVSIYEDQMNKTGMLFARSTTGG